MEAGETSSRALRKAKRAFIINRRNRVMELYFRRKTQQQIAIELSISPTVVFEDIKATIADYKRHYNIDTMALVVLEVERINRLEAKAWEAYELSCQPKKIGKVTSGLDGVTTSATVIERNEGDVAFLRLIGDCIEMRIKLLRLDKRADKDEEEKQMQTFSEYMAYWWKKRDAAEKLPKVRAPIAKPRGPLP